MRRADRLFRIVEYLKARRETVTAKELGEELEVGVRTIYRDIADLRASGVPLTGEAGVGYLLSPNYVVRPLLFDDEELEALALGAQMVQSWADPAMAQAARRALDRITVVLPDSLADNIRQSTSYAYPSAGKPALQIDFTSLRRAIGTRHLVEFAYIDQNGSSTTRRIRPLAIIFLAPNWMVAAWCELRRDFRHFRVDRMQELVVLDEKFELEPGKTLDDMQRQCEEEFQKKSPSATS
ncbi:helix-turn-helix transcriptional regulator [Rhodopirellula halodulae]|uniref:helix-turn-helix transcriptional regulator n=1 Tax=Rhodopirellula halodulae TaxID=2894198 RepID=UPI001E4DD401|nr:YafY family protein [Rhodopirellula sp. JC737]MCC9654517.1 YafY family transcriptional regulator [Rhodopirellula sp. JC737]